MTESVPLHEAEGHLAELVERARSGEDIVLTSQGRPVARLVGTGRDDQPSLSDRLIARSTRRPLRFGLLEGRIRIADDFDDELPEDVLKAFHGVSSDETWPGDDPARNS